MPQLEFAGRYNGKILDSQVSQTAKSNFWQFELVLEVTERWNAETRQLEKLPEPIQTHAWLLLQGTDKETGAIRENNRQIEAIQGFAPEWKDTDDLEALHNLDLRGRAVSIKAEANEYEGKTSVRIAWVNAPGGMRETAPEVVKAMKKGWKTAKAPAVTKTATARESDEV